MVKVINIAKDFSRYPAGRNIGDGPWSGAKFREEYLIPALEKDCDVEVILDGTRGYGSSFLEEAFGGLVRRGYVAIKDRLKFNTSSDSLRVEILEYIDDAVREAEKK